MRAQVSGRTEVPWQVHWYGIDVVNTSAWTPGPWEADLHFHYTRMRAILARDRNILLSWHALAHALTSVAVVSRNLNRYLSLRYSGAYYITDLLGQAEPPGKDRGGVQPSLQRNFTDLRQELRRAGSIPLSAPIRFALTTVPASSSSSTSTRSSSRSNLDNGVNDIHSSMRTARQGRSGGALGLLHGPRHRRSSQVRQRSVGARSSSGSGSGSTVGSGAGAGPA